MRKNKRTVVLIVYEAHELHHKTLTGFKRLMELAAGAGVFLSVLLIGHTKLRNDLRRPMKMAMILMRCGMIRCSSWLWDTC